MMEVELLDLFHKWVPLYVRLPVLFLLLFAILTANGIFLGNFNEMANNLGVYAESFTEAYNVQYIGMGLGLIFYYRLKLRFTNKQLLLFGLVTQLGMNIVCATTSNTIVFIAGCLVVGFAKMYALVEVYIIWMFIWSKKFDASRLYPFIYFTALSGIYLVTWLTASLAFHYNWRYAYIAICVMLLACILCAVIFVENNALKHKLPLFQVDYLGLCLLAASLLLLNYAIVNGRVEEWQKSKAVAGAFIGSAITMLLFARRQLELKRPLLDLAIFQVKTFRRGLFYCLLLGIFFPGNFQAAFSGGILQYDAVTNVGINLYLIPGVFAGCVFCYCCYYFKVDTEIITIAGFLSFVAYHLILYYSFSINFSAHNFILPSVLKGSGTSVLYIALGLLTIKGFGLDKIISASGVLLIVRSFLASGVFTGIYSYLLYTQRIRHIDYLESHLDANSYLVHDFGRVLYQEIQRQATLNGSKELTGIIIIVGFAVLGYLVASYLVKKIKGDLSPES